MYLGNELNFESSAEMLNENKYWKIISNSLARSRNEDEQENILIKEIERLSPREIIGFRLRTDYLLYYSYTSEMWCAGYIMNGGCSDDGFEYFRNWVISRGKSAYYGAKTNPDNLIKEVNNNIFYEFEGFWSVALQAFENRTGRNLYDYIDYDKFKTRESNYPRIKFTWTPENLDSMKAICPKLFQRLWK